jgi:hemerythrin-like domain-containing protein
VVALLRKHIAPHADWEERVLYVIVDRQAGGGTHKFTASMRHEHRIIARQLDDLVRESVRPAPDAKRFARKADRLLGLIAAHFEEEEEVLLGVLDLAMTPEEFKREVMRQEEHGNPKETEK